MRKSLRSLLLFSLSVLVLFSACQKDGSTGPEGPQGPQGQPGPQGNPGTANVIYSDWLDVEFGLVINQNDDTDTLGYGAEIAAPKLTADLIASGEIKVYVNAGYESNPLVTPLPLLEVYENGIITISPYFEEGYITMFANVNASTFLAPNGDKSFQYRYVLIPGSVLATKPANVELDNYQSVQKYLKLND